MRKYRCPTCGQIADHYVVADADCFSCPNNCPYPLGEKLEYIRAPVQLMTAWTWDCPTCERRNFTNGVVEHELAESERQALGLDDDENCVAVSAPDEVVCAHCLSSFPVDLDA